MSISEVESSQASHPPIRDDPRYDVYYADDYFESPPPETCSVRCRSRLSRNARLFYEFFNSLQFLGSLVLLWYSSQVLFNWARCENCCCSASCSTGSSHCHFPNYDNTDDDMGDPTRYLINALIVVSLLQIFGAYMCACNIAAMRCIVAGCSAASVCYGIRCAVQLTWLVCRPVPNPVGNNDNWKGVGWRSSSHGRNCVHILIAHACILAADCLLTLILCLVNPASFNPREKTAVTSDSHEQDGSKRKSD